MALPTRTRRTAAVSSTTNDTSWTPSFTTWSDNDVIAGGASTIWIMWVAADGVPTLSTASSGWTKVGQASDDVGAVTGAIFKYESTEAFAASAYPAFVLNSSGLEQFAAILVAYTATGSGTMSLILPGAGFYRSAAPDILSSPPSWTNSTGGTIDAYSIVCTMIDAANAPTANPSGYSALLTRNGSGTNGASLRSAEKTMSAMASGATETPGTVPHASQESVAHTMGVYETAGLSAIQGTVTLTLASLSSSSSGAIALASSTAKTLEGVTLACNSTVALKSDTAKTLANLTLSADGSSTVPGINGTLAKTLVGITCSSSGALAATGTLSATLGTLNAASATNIAIAGAVSAALDAVSVLSTSGSSLIGLVNGQLSGLTVSSTGALTPLSGASLSVTLEPLVGSSGATMPMTSVTASVTLTLGDLSLTSDATVEVIVMPPTFPVRRGTPLNAYKAFKTLRDFRER